MKNALRRIVGLPLFSLALIVAGCENAGGPEHLTGPSIGSPSFTDGVTTEAKFKALKGVYGGKTRTDEQVIQPSAGGNVGVAGNVIIIPAGAVSEPTLFRMMLVPQDEDGLTKVQVELRAYQRDRQGRYKVDVGPAGFLKPIEVRLTTEWVTKAFVDSQVQVVWQKEDGSQEVQPTDRSPDGRFRAYLNHFSDYILGVP